MKTKIVLIGILFLLGLSRVSAQDDLTFTASAPQTVQAGQQFQYVIEGSEQGEVELPDLGDFQLLAGPFSSYSSHSQWVNGRMNMQTIVSYAFVLRIDAEGTHTIPPASIRVGRKNYKTNEVTVTVGPAGNQSGAPSASPRPPATSSPQSREASDDAVFLRVHPSRNSVFLGEQLVAELKVYTRVNTRPASNSGDLAYEGFYKQSLDPDATASRETVDGQQYVTQVLQRHILIPQKTGDLVIAPYESDWMIQQKVQRQSPGSLFDDIFNDPFFDNYQDVPVTLKTLPVQIKVKPLPQGAPEGFTGGVGSFHMEAELSASELDINEALSLRITIRGMGNLPLLGEPRVSLPLDHDLYDVDRKVHSSTNGQKIQGSVQFEYPIIARHAGNFRIPPVVFAWFDPSTGRYHQETTEEFNFSVRKGRGEESNGGVYVPGVGKESVDDIGTDIRDISRSEPHLRPVGFALMGNRMYAIGYLILLLGATAIFVLLRMVARRNADLTLLRNRKANSAARKRLKNAQRCLKSRDLDGFYEETTRAFWGYMSDKLSLETSRLTRESVQSDLRSRQVPAEAVEEFTRILDECEYSRYAPSSQQSEPQKLLDDAIQMIQNLETHLS
ncbi:MAG: BatD family protein [Bacteroidales bacterium]